MVGREDIVAVGEEVSVADALWTAIAAGHRRVVVFGTGIDDVAQLIEEMRSSGTWLAVARDAEGRSAGLATVEDVLAELMGEIEEGPAVEPT